MDIPDHSPKGSFLCLRITSPIPAINTRNVSHLRWCNIFHLHNFLPAKGLFPDQILFNYKIYVSGFLSYNKAVYHNFKILIALLKQHYVFFMFSGCSFKDNTESTLDNWQSLLEKGPKLVRSHQGLTIHISNKFRVYKKHKFVLIVMHPKS